jgi:hypothetical protein
VAPRGKMLIEVKSRSQRKTNKKKICEILRKSGNLNRATNLLFKLRKVWIRRDRLNQDSLSGSSSQYPLEKRVTNSLIDRFETPKVWEID